MRRILRIWFVCSVFSVLLLGLCLPCFGANSLQQANAQVGTEKCGLLDGLCNDHYLNKLDKDEQGAELNTCMVIQGYVTRIKGLMYSERAQNEDLSAEMTLLYKKGEAAGRLSWIYYSHSETSALSSVWSIYDSKLAVIDSATSAAFFDNGAVEDCYTDLFQIIYTEKLNSLAREGDSQTVLAMIGSAPATMGSACKYDSIGSDGEDGGNYKAFYLSVVRSVTEQRNRDRTATEVGAVFGVLYPTVAPECSPVMSEFFNSLSTKNDILGMNTLMSETVGRLLSGLSAEGREYRNAYLSAKGSGVCDAVLSAGSLEIADISGLFDGHALCLSAADAKDSLTDFGRELAETGSYNDAEIAELQKIINEFTAEGGGFDLASDVSDVEGRLFISKTRCVWVDIYISTVKEIRSFLGEGSEIERSAAVLYDATALEINNGGRSGGKEIPENLISDREKMNGFADEAEAESFRIKHRDILLKPDVGVSDRAAIALALLDGADLSEGAEALLRDILLSLGEKYKEAVSEEIASHVTADGAQRERIAAAERLVAMVGSLSAVDKSGNFELMALKERADGLLLRSEMTAELFDCYAAYYLSVGGECFAERARQVAVGASLEIAEAEGGGELIAEEARLKLLRLASLERIYACAEGYEDVSEVSALLSGCEPELDGYGEKEKIEEYTQRQTAELARLIRLAEIDRACEKLGLLGNDIKTEIMGYQYISEGKREELLASLSSLLFETLTEVETAVDKEAVLLSLERGRESLSVFLESARLSENAACLDSVRAELQAACGKKEDYSPDNYLKILDILGRCEAELSGASDISEYIAIGRGGIAEIGEIEDLSKEARRLSLALLLAEYQRLLEKKHCYSPEGLASLSEIYEHTVAEISALTAVADAPRVTALAEERIVLMRGIRLQMVYTEDGGLALDENYRYPEGYDISAGYSGSVRAEGGIPSDTLLYIRSCDAEGIEALIRRAARKGLIFCGEGRAERDILKLLKGCYISAAVDIDMSGADGGAYRVSVLLPDSVELSDLVGVIFVGEDGRVEFHPATRGESVVEFDTDHFSKYYIVSRGSADLTPWIVSLSIIVLCELIFVAILLIRKKKRMGGGALAAIAMPFALSAKQGSVNAETAVVILCGVALALGGLIAYLLLDELRYAKKKRLKLLSSAQVSEPLSRNTEADAVLALVTDMETDASVEMDTEPIARIAEPLISEPSSLVMPSVSAEEADRLMSDGEAAELNDSRYEDGEIYYGRKKAEVNIDIISECFESGAVVSLNSLKERGLVRDNVGHVKILARGILDKPLTVVAQDFSRSALKMILLTGGEAVFTYPSAERGGKKEQM